MILCLLVPEPSRNGRFYAVRDTSDIFAIPLAIYDATRPMKKTGHTYEFSFFL
jgi:hypothetical protein